MLCERLRIRACADDRDSVWGGRLVVEEPLDEEEFAVKPLERGPAPSVSDGEDARAEVFRLKRGFHLPFTEQHAQPIEGRGPCGGNITGGAGIRLATVVLVAGAGHDGPPASAGITRY